MTRNEPAAAAAARGSIWAAPVGLFALSLIGLIAALVGDGWWDAVSWVCLAAPLVVIARFVVR